MKCEQQKISVKRREMYFYFIYALSTVCDHSAQEYLAYCLNVNTLKDYRSEPKLLAPFFSPTQQHVQVMEGRESN